MFATSALRPCACSLVTVNAALDTGCTAQTRNLFAPGHDAKLKGMLIKAGASDLQVTVEGAAHDPAKIAGFFGFATLVEAGIARHKAEAKAKVERQVATKAKADAAAKAKVAAAKAKPAKAKVAA